VSFQSFTSAEVDSVGFFFVLSYQDTYLNEQFFYTLPSYVMHMII